MTPTATAAGNFKLGDKDVRRMGFGAMRITGEGIWGPPEDHDESIRVLKRAVELGVNFIDTADSYGPHVSEEILAEAPFPYPEDLVIATKGDDKTREEFTLKEGETKTMSLKLAGAAAATEKLGNDPAETVKDKTPPPTDDTGSNTKVTVGWILTGVGVAALGTSLAFYGVRASKMRELEGACVDSKCPPSAGDTIDSAKTFTTLGHITLGVGVAALGTGIVLLVTGKKAAPEEPKAARFVPYAPGSQIGFGIEGAF